MRRPYYKQETDYTCGPASFRMCLHRLGIIVSESEAVELLETKKNAGTKIKHFSTAADKLKLKYIEKKNSELNDISKFLKEGYLIIVNYYVPGFGQGHQAVVIKIDSKQVYLDDPHFGRSHKISLKHFERNWRCKDEPVKRWLFGVKA